MPGAAVRRQRISDFDGIMAELDFVIRKPLERNNFKPPSKEMVELGKLRVSPEAWVAWICGSWNQRPDGRIVPPIDIVGNALDGDFTVCPRQHRFA
jgi:hypothetical protein